MMDRAELHVMEHATGWRSKRPLYRNHFCAGPDHEDWPVLQELCVRGLMRVSMSAEPALGGQSVFTVTEQGIAKLKELAQ